MNNPWNFQTVFITGASSGLGRHLAIALAQKNIPQMILTGRNPDKLSSLASYLHHFVNKVIFFSADLTLEQERQKVLSQIAEYQPDLLINNAGFGIYGSAFQISRKDQTDVFKVNALAPLEFTLETIRYLSQQKRRGVILNISSIAAFFSVPFMGTYSASKAFLNNFSESLDYECKPKGIRILTICPGAMNTKFSQTAAKGKKVKQPMSMLKEDVVNTILWQIEKRKRKVILDGRYRFGRHVLKLIPNVLKMKIFQNSCMKRASS